MDILIGQAGTRCIKDDKGHIHLLCKDGNGFEYYFPDNQYRTDGEFIGRAKDAFNTIMADSGDMLSDKYSVIRYLNRDYGKKVREAQINKFKGCKFWYSIKLEDGCGYSSAYITVDGTEVTFDKDKAIRFDSEEAAQAWVDDFNSNMDWKSKEILLYRSNKKDRDFNYIEDCIFQNHINPNAKVFKFIITQELTLADEENNSEN